MTGPANASIGKTWMVRVRNYLQDNGYPYADLMNRKGISDFTGVGDMAIEATTETWGRISEKLEQATRDAKGRSARVWKPRKSRTGDRGRPVGECFAIMTIAQDLAREQLIAELQHQVLTLRTMIREDLKEGAGT